MKESILQNTYNKFLTDFFQEELDKKVIFLKFEIDLTKDGQSLGEYTEVRSLFSKPYEVKVGQHLYWNLFVRFENNEALALSIPPEWMYEPKEFQYVVWSELTGYSGLRAYISPNRVLDYIRSKIKPEKYEMPRSFESLKLAETY